MPSASEPIPLPDELTIAQAAALAGCTEAEIGHAYMSGRLALRVAGGPSAARFVCSRQDLATWQASCPALSRVVRVSTAQAARPGEDALYDAAPQHDGPI